MSKQTFRLRNNFILNILFSCSSVLLALFGLLTFVPPYNPEKQAEALIDPDLYTISVNAVSDISLQVNPSAAGTVAMVEDVITSSTNSPSGYRLYVSVDSDHNDIYLNGDSRNNETGKKISATSGTFDSPASLMNDSSSSWGYAVPGLSNFDATYDPASPSSSAKFAALPVVGEEQLIHEHEGVATDDTTSVYYGAKVDSNIAAGHYVANVVYTSMTDISSITNGELTVSPNDFTENYEPVTITITTSLSTSREVGTVTATVGGTICDNLNIIDYDPLAVTCTLPAGLSNARHDVTLNIPRLGKSYQDETGITIAATTHTCTKQYRLQNADGTYPDEYTADPDQTETITHGETCSYTKSVTDYQEQTATVTPFEDTAISLDLPRDTYELTITHNDSIVSVSGAGTYRWGQEVPVSAVSTGEFPFRKWKQKEGETSTFTDATQIETSFIMPKSNAMIFADGGSACDYEPGQEWEFPYTGEPVEFPTPCSGKYKLEVWGASGYSNYTSGGDGKGGYSYGEITLEAEQPLYVVVGGRRGYNGGGGSTIWDGVDSMYRENHGGGATHIALGTNRGTLSSYSSYKSEILIVAGGGGSAAYWSYSGGAGNTGGGYSFGQGASGSTFSRTDSYGRGHSEAGACGGGGWSGGTASSTSSRGGTGYVDGVQEGQIVAGNASMPTYDGTATMTGNANDGYAKITLLED